MCDESEIKLSIELPKLNILSPFHIRRLLVASNTTEAIVMGIRRHLNSTYETGLMAYAAGIIVVLMLCLSCTKNQSSFII
jgi:hypothetical protein